MTAAVLNRPAPVAPASRARRAARTAATWHGESISTAPRRELDTIGCHWQAALDTAGRALDANAILLAPAEIRTRRRRLTAERQASASLLRRLARARGVEPAPWLPAIPGALTRR
jgi:hypothetical protein